MKFSSLFEKHRESAQLAYGVVLIIIIPLLIALNTLFIMSQYNHSIDVVLQRQALSVGRSISTLMRADLPWEDFLQAKLGTLASSNPELLELSVLKPDGDDFKIIASTESGRIGQTTTSYFYKLAWVQPENDGLATDSMHLTGPETEYEDFSEGKIDRFWLVAVPMRDDSNEKQALLAVKLSSQIVDELTRYNRNASIYLLAGTVLVVILFLLVVVRLWDYAVLYKKTKEIDKLKDEFVSMASHELRTPITGISGFIRMLLAGDMGELSGQARQALQMTLSASKRLANLVDDLLAVGRIEQGRMSLKTYPQDPDPIIRGTLKEFSLQAAEKGLHLGYHPHSPASPHINIDSDRFKQVLINLIGNAIKYTPQGDVQIVTRSRYDGRVLEIVVKDSGIGMSAGDRERLFEKFYRIRNGETAKISGTGLGLWITRQLTEMMHGTIMVDSIEKVGTQMTLQFPVVNRDAESAERKS